MRTRHDIRIAVFVFLVFNLVIAFGSISLLERMTPAIQGVLQANVYSIAAVEEMFSTLAEPSDRDVTERSQKFRAALDRAKKNITESQETELIESIDRGFEGALAGDVVSRLKVISDLRLLGEVNREAIRKADQKAVRLGKAGSWIIVLLGAFGFLLSLIILTRLNRQVVRPVEEIYDAVREWKEGNSRRRCNHVDAPPELQNTMTVINHLIDQSEEPDSPRKGASVDADRQVLVHLLEEKKAPVLIMDGEGQIVAANNRALEVLSLDRKPDVREELARVRAGEASAVVAESRALEASGFWYFVLKSAD